MLRLTLEGGESPVHDCDKFQVFLQSPWNICGLAQFKSLVPLGEDVGKVYLLNDLLSPLKNSLT